MIKIITKRIGDCQDCKNLVDYICSSRADLANLPKLENYVASGSTCICTEDNTIHILGADDVWYNLTNGGASVNMPTVTIDVIDEYGDECYDRFKYSVDGGKTWHILTDYELYINANRISFTYENIPDDCFVEMLIGSGINYGKIISVGEDIELTEDLHINLCIRSN